MDTLLLVELLRKDYELFYREKSKEAADKIEEMHYVLTKALEYFEDREDITWEHQEPNEEMRLASEIRGVLK